VNPIAHFDAVWARCTQLTTLHNYIATNTSSVLQPDELLRAEWVARVSALDLYVHELIAQRMLEIFQGHRPTCNGYKRFQISNDTVHRIRLSASQYDADAAFDLDVRTQLGFLSFQDPERIADGVRLCSSVELWNEVAVNLGATPQTRTDDAKRLKKELSLIVLRRNQIAHEGDLRPTPTRDPWQIAKADVRDVALRLDSIVRAIDKVA
jgi:hypothetical protein